MQGGADASDDFAEKVEALIVKRNTARANKNWADADAARDELNALGVVLEDSVQGTTWRRA
jgi:cysteinyl-tRNA synthetase